jgi:hypothetical protein
MARTTQVTLNFISPIEKHKLEKPYRLYVGASDLSPEATLTNYGTKPVTGIHIEDVRGEENKYNIDTQGFQFVKHSQSFTDFGNAEDVDKSFIPQVEKVILDNIPYAERVVVFDWRVGTPSPFQ